MNLIEERTIALAAVLQAAQQVQRLARTGFADSVVEETAKQSILVLDAVNTPAVFGGLNRLSNGLKLLADGVLVSPGPEDVEILRYTMSLLHLQTQLSRDDQRFGEFGSEIERLSGESKEGLPEACSAVYQKYVSSLQPQIIVQGEEDYLQQAEIPPRVRTLLLAGIRAAVLWQQKGGGRFKMLWERTRMRNAAQALLQQGTVS